jgi:hypothetical protein
MASGLRLSFPLTASMAFTTIEGRCPGRFPQEVANYGLPLFSGERLFYGDSLSYLSAQHWQQKVMLFLYMT